MKWLIPFLLLTVSAQAQSLSHEDRMVTLKALEEMHQQAMWGWHPVPLQAAPDLVYEPRITTTMADIRSAISHDARDEHERTVFWRGMTVTRLALARFSSELDVCFTFHHLEATAVCVEDRDGNGRNFAAMKNY